MARRRGTIGPLAVESVHAHRPVLLLHRRVRRDLPTDTGSLAAATDGPAPAARRRLRWRPGVEPRSRTVAAIGIGFVGVLVAERAATIAPVALPLLLVTGLLGSLLRDGWGGPAWTWIGGAVAEALGGLAYLATRSAADAQWDPLVPLFLAAGVALFAGLFFAGFAVVAVARRLFSRRTADAAVVVIVLALLAVAVASIVAGPAGDLVPTPATETPASGTATDLSAVRTERRDGLTVMTGSRILHA
jgi:hypothetical protein